MEFNDIKPGQARLAPIVDLYLAHNLSTMPIRISSLNDVNSLPRNDFLQLTRDYYLPETDTPEIRNRASRITKFYQTYTKRIKLPNIHKNSKCLWIYIIPLQVIEGPIYQQIILIVFANL